MDLNYDEIVKSYFNQTNILVKHQIDSYEEYIDKILPNIISNYFPIHMKFDSDKIKTIILDVDNVKIGKPFTTENNGCSKILTPDIARLRNYSYMAPIYVDFKSSVTICDNNTFIKLNDKIIKNIIIGYVPIVLRSKYCVLNNSLYNNECKYDHGGYSIINGNEKVIISQERSVYNIPLVFKNNKKTSKYSHVCEIRTLHESNYFMPKISSIKITKKENTYDNVLKVSLPHLKQEIPLFVLFKALGCISDKEIIHYIINNDGSKFDELSIKILYLSIKEGEEIMTEPDALEYISRYINNNIYNLTDDKKIKKLSKDIIETQEKEIILMKKLINLIK